MLLNKKKRLSSVPIFGEVLGKGAEKVCYANPYNPLTCYKVSTKYHAKATKREISFFIRLEQNAIHSSFLPKFYGFFENSDFVGYEQERFKNADGTSLPVLDFIPIATEEQINELNQFLKKLKQELITKNLIISDLAPRNLALQLSKSGKIVRLVIIDGFGSPEFIPIAEYFKFFGEKKIERQWKKFEIRYQKDLTRLRHLRNEPK